MVPKARSFSFDGTDYVAVPKAEYLRLVGDIDAETAVNDLIGKKLRAARKEAGLTQTELARRLGVKQPMVSAAEHGRGIGDRYVARVLRACKLPAGWIGPRVLKRGRKVRAAPESGMRESGPRGKGKK